jgi:hypothetical protein
MVKKFIIRSLVMMGYVVTLIGLLFAGNWFFNQAEREIHLIPKGYVGPVVIIYGRPHGAPPKYENGVRVYEIPKNGILLTQFDPNCGVIPPHGQTFCYVDDSGSRTEVPQGFQDNASNNGIQIMSPSIGSTPKSTFTSYIVGSKKQGDSLYQILDTLDVDNYK